MYVPLRRIDLEKSFTRQRQKDFTVRKVFQKGLSNGQKGNNSYHNAMVFRFWSEYGFGVHSIHWQLHNNGGGTQYKAITCKSQLAKLSTPLAPLHPVGLMSKFSTEGNIKAVINLTAMHEVVSWP